MKTLYVVISIATLALLAPAASAVIINIPGDYPTIQEGIDTAQNGDTVLVQPGMYIENINFNGHNVVLGSLFLTTGDTDYISSTIIDGNDDGSVVSFWQGEDNGSCIAGFTIQNGWSLGYGGGISCSNSRPIISNNIIRRNSGFAVGGGIYSWSGGEPIIEGNIIADNYAGSGAYGGEGGGICIGSGTIRRNLIVRNRADHGASFQRPALGGGICHLGGSPLLIENNTLCDNSATSPVGGMGGGLYFWVPDSGDVVIRNNIIVFNSLGGGVSGSINDTTWTGWDYNLVFGNEHYDYDGIEPAPHDIQADPLFVDRFSGDYHLMSVVCGDSSDSPCIDAGDPSIVDSILDCDWGLGEAISDMGAYGGGDSTMVGIDDDKQPEAPIRFGLSQNYPNPFNASTIINYTLPKPSHVAIEIYDILGRRVETLVQREQPAGYHQVVWDGKDKNDKMVSTGIYFYELYVDDYRESKAMIMIK
ncbi:MAG: FlgD immunoglobulin-like domain containing protein [candidate division Zixibacteria bacterium]